MKRVGGLGEGVVGGKRGSVFFHPSLALARGGVTIKDDRSSNEIAVFFVKTKGPTR